MLILLWLHRAGGPSVMKAEHLRMWHRSAKREEDPDPGNWDKVVALIQKAFRGLELVVPCTCQMVVIMG